MRRPREGAVLDRRTLNRTLLGRQLLLDRASMPVAETIEHLVGMQAQAPNDPYVALWSRLRDFDPHELADLLLQHSALRMTLQRGTLHLVTARDALALRPAMQDMLERRFGTGATFGGDISDLDRSKLFEAGSELLDQEPLSISELGRLLAERFPGYDSTSLSFAIAYVLPVVQVTPRGVWGKKMRAKLATLESWVGERAADRAAPDDAILRYLRAFGPASTADIRTWSGIAGAREAIARLRPQLRSYRDENGRELFDAADAPFTAPDVPAPPRLLPEYDNILLSHDDRSRITAGRSFTVDLAFKGTALVDGYLSGAWRLRTERDAAVLTLEYDPTPRRTIRNEVEAEAQRLLEFLTPDAKSRSLKVVA